MTGHKLRVESVPARDSSRIFGVPETTFICRIAELATKVRAHREDLVALEAEARE